MTTVLLSYRVASSSRTRFQAFSECNPEVPFEASPVLDSAIMDVARAKWRELPNSLRVDVYIIDSETGAEVWRYGHPSADWTPRGLRGLRVGR